jgi:hypothetical protein
MRESVFSFFKYIEPCHYFDYSTPITSEGDGIGILNFMNMAFFSEFSVTDSIFYFSNNSAPATVVITHPYSS